MKITIRVPDPELDQTPIRAHQEDQIDFRLDQVGADRTTVAFAALELKQFLDRTIAGAEVAFASTAIGGNSRGGEEDLSIHLRISPDGRPVGSYRFEPEIRGLTIAGEDRTGVLYGVYHFLESQGWKWLSPGPGGEIPPETGAELTLPARPETHSPAFTLCRGFDFAARSMESVELLHWMARNRLNLAGHRPTTGALGRKLGMLYKNGGHIFEPILDPDRVLEDGRTVWEAHRNWYGRPAKGELTKANALRTQFCVSQPDLLDFLAEELVHKIETEWSEADLVAVWGFDTWGSCCTCEKCRSLGNDSDQYVFLLSRLRQEIDKARASGRLRYPVRMAGCAYEGTSTLGGPSGAIPQNLIDAGDAIIFYPIDRSYAADLNDPSSDTNRPYDAALDSWLNRSERLPVIVGEYYNVSKYEDLPALFTKRIENDLKAYHDRGITGMTYMHFPMVNWAVRTLTQYHYARANWNTSVEAGPLVRSYLNGRYGPHGKDMADAYGLIESGYSRIGEWRNWHSSVLEALMHWDGAPPGKPLKVANDLGDAAGAICDGERSLGELSQALQMIEALVQREQERDAENPDLSFRVAVNPVDYTGMKRGSPYALSLGEDRRLLRYGCDTMELMTEMVRYHDALVRNDLDLADLVWRRLEGVADRMDTYWVPIEYIYPGPGLNSRDALSRTQLRDLIARCRRWRRTRGPVRCKEKVQRNA
ncbi:MAG: DUF4838 domain-containing protein [Opitutaceae bacterium]